MGGGEVGPGGLRRVASGLSTAGSGSRGRQGAPLPWQLCLVHSGATAAVPQGQPCPESLSTWCWARVSSGCKQGFLK